MEDANEEKLLRAVTLQNARAILHARERAEQELLKAKEELEQSNQQITELLARERETREEAETLNEVTRTLAGELDLQKLLQSVTDAGTKLTGAKFGAFFYNVTDDSGESYLLYTLSGAPREAFEKFSTPRNTDLFAHTFHGAGVVRSADILQHPQYGKNPPHYGMPRGHLPVRSYLAVPVKSRSGEVIGGLFFGHPEPGVFTERAERMGVGIAAQAAIAIDNARLFAKAEKEIADRKQAEEALRESEQRLRQANAELAQRVAELQQATAEIRDSRRAALNLMEDAIQSRQAMERLNAELRASEVLVDSQRQALQLLAEGASLDEVLGFLIGVVERHSAEGMLAAITPLNEAGTHFQRGVGASLPDTFNAAVEGVAVSSPTGLCATAVRRRAAVAVHDFNADPAWQPFGEFVAPYGLRSGWSAPIISASGHMLGTFANYSRRAGDPTPPNRELVDMVVRTAAIAIERKRAEETVRESEERFRSLVSVITDVPWITDATGAFIARQPAWEAYTGQSWEEYRGFGWANALHADDREQIKATWERACKNRTLYESHGRLWHAPSGEYRYFVARATPLLNPDATVREWVGACTDIHERKQAEAALRQSEEKFKLLFDRSPLPKWAFDVETLRFVDVNEAAVQHYGYSREEFLRMSVLDLRTPEAGEAIQAALARPERRLPESETCQHRQKSGAIIDVEVRFSEITLAGKQVCLASINDITERKQAEEERERLLASEQQARAEAEEANRHKDEFLATISHELRTPLNSILGWANTLLRGVLDEQAATRALETIARNAKAQAQLIGDLLDVSRIISGKLRFETGAVDLIPVTEAALETVRPAAEAKGVELRATLDPTAGPVSGDAGRLQQVVWNLLTNAIKYTPRGGHVETRLERAGSQVTIIVRDTGEGISADFLPYVFTRFRQADGTTTRQHGGLGLGLAIVRHLVEAHGGRVRAASEGAGQGATFTVTLPLMILRSADFGLRNEDTVDEQSTIPTGLRVLVVDDDQDSRELLRLWLTESGAEVKVSATAREALDLMEQWQPEVLVSDIGMPDEDGYELMRQVRALPAERGGQVPAVALTGYARLEDQRRALAAGYQIFVPKPVDLPGLVAAIARLAGRTGKI